MQTRQVLSPKAEKTTFKDKTKVEVDGVTGDIVTEYTFNHKDGSVVIKQQLTTEQISFDEDTQDAVLERCNILLRENYLESAQLLKDFLESQMKELQEEGIFASNSYREDEDNVPIQSY